MTKQILTEQMKQEINKELNLQKAALSRTVLEEEQKRNEISENLKNFHTASNEYVQNLLANKKQLHKEKMAQIEDLSNTIDHLVSENKTTELTMLLKKMPTT